eukprot:6668015-Lingulodinium_polyedra.AAC.1
MLELWARALMLARALPWIFAFGQVAVCSAIHPITVEFVRRAWRRSAAYWQPLFGRVWST